MKQQKEHFGKNKNESAGVNHPSMQGGFILLVILILVTVIIWISPIIGFATVAWAIISYLILRVINWNAVKKRTVKESLIPNQIIPENIRVPSNMPLPYAVLSNSKRIMLYNEEFTSLFPEKELAQVFIGELIKDFKLHINKQVVEINQKFYEVYAQKCEVIDEAKGMNRDIYSICLVDITANRVLQKEVENQKTVVALIFLDNYEEMLDTLDEERLPILTALIDRKMNALAVGMGGVVKKFEKDRYIFLLSQAKLEELKEKKFDILNEIREISVGDHIPVTLSIGVGIGQESLDVAMKNAKAAIDLALGRGGDQVLIKDGEKYLFYGGKSGEVSHNARIRARVKADALWELMGESSEILVMGHKQADLDSLGACIGIYTIAKTMGKSCHIVLDTVSVGVKRLYERMMEYGGYENVFLNCTEALRAVSDKALVVVTDTHRYTMTECPELLSETKKIVVFDHHRKSTDFIENAVLIYHEPYASSTSELVTEMIQYFGEKIKLKPIEADALLAGITVDTKNFCVKTGAITFEAAAFLRRNGADGIRVRMLFQNDMEAYKAKASAVKDAVIFRENIAISICPSNVENTILTAAQAADDLLNVIGIKASFVCCLIEQTVYISARSFGEINVQVIMEKLGGGGHLTVSGAQLKDCTLEEACKKIRNAIDQYLEEEN